MTDYGDFTPITVAGETRDLEAPERTYTEAEAQAMVAAALDAVKDGFVEGDICDQIDALTPTDPRAALDRLIAEAVEAEREAWQPIDTAPKDGAPILVYADGEVSVARYVGGFVKRFWCMADGNDVFDSFCDGRSEALEIEPAYWRPMPNPPAGEG